jgi:hypothetical protein
MRLLALAIGCSLATASAPAFADPSTDDGGEAEAGSRVPAYVATGVTGALLITSVVSFFEYTASIKERRDKLGAQREDWYQAAEDADRWHTIGLFAVGATIVAGGVTGYLWTRTEKPRTHFTVTAHSHGGTAWLGGRF